MIHPAYFFILLLLPAQVHGATPGSLLESNFPTFSSQAEVSAAAVADDGSVFIAGGFSAVDGVARAGLAKLSSTGTLDPTFSGTLLDDLEEPWVALGDDVIATPALFPLPNGRLIQLARNSWTLHNADGAPNVVMMAEFPRSGNKPPRPQFVTAARVFMIGGTPAVIKAYRANDLSLDGNFQMRPVPRPVWQCVPAADGKLWVLGRTPASIEDSWPPLEATYVLFRLGTTGAIDPSFVTRNLPEGYSYSLSAMADGGFRLTSDWRFQYWMWPGPTGQALQVQRFDAAGGALATVGLFLPFGWNSCEVVFQASDRMIYPNMNATRLIRNRPSSSHDPDPTFQIMLAAPESPVLGPTQIRTLDEFADGKLLVGGTRRMLADGAADGTWHIPRLEKNATVSRLTRLADGSLLAMGDFDRADGQAAAGVVRLLVNDRLDAEFTPEFDFRLATKIRAFPDGSLLALFSVPAADSLGRQSELVRFSANGAFMSLWPVPNPPGSATFSFGQVTDFAIQSDGTTLVTTFQNISVPSSGFHRIQPDGALQYAFPGNFQNFQLGSTLLLLDDDTYLLGNIRYAADGALLGPLAGISVQNPAVQLPDRSVIFFPAWGNSPTQKWHPVTGVDANFTSSGQGTAFSQIVTAAANDKLFIMTFSPISLRFISGQPVQVSSPPRANFTRLQSTGQVDPTFRPPLADISNFLADGDDTMLITGSFDTVDGEPRSGIARLADTRAVGFPNWMAAATARSGLASGSLAATADPDHDGSSNFLEYAAGSDPLGTPTAQPRQLAGATWRLPCNPEAPEISRRLETSTNLSQWRPARGNEVRVDVNGGCLTWSLLPGAGKLFIRVRIE